MKKVKEDKEKEKDNFMITKLYLVLDRFHAIYNGSLSQTKKYWIEWETRIENISWSDKGR